MKTSPLRALGNIVWNSTQRVCIASLLFACAGWSQLAAENATPERDRAVALPGAWRAAAIPTALRPWQSWVLWEKSDQLAGPQIYHRPGEHWGLWSSTLGLNATAKGADFFLEVTNFRSGWVMLPGGSNPGQVWPQDVRFSAIGSGSGAGQNQPGIVLDRGRRPAVWLEPGSWRISGRLLWSGVPERILVPPDAGILQVRVEGRELELPMVDGEGGLWLRQEPRAEAAAENFLGLQAYGLLEDGSPLWLRLEVELIVAGQTREENLGRLLPDGWKLASVEAPIPVVIDPSGQALARVKPGRWVVRLSAYRLDHPEELAFPEGAKFSEWLVGWRARPDFRSVEIEGLTAIDVAQTNFPESWRDGPVYRWDSGGTLRLIERLRGPGEAAAPGLQIAREWWLGEDGREFVFRDQIQGTAQTLWRLDATAGQVPGSVTQNGVGLLLTKNPATGQPGVEIRQRNLQLTALGTLERTEKIAASGWLANADNLEVRLNLPPGWRAFAVFGPDFVDGEWITLWSLLDLFLLLVFVLAVFRLYGFGAAALALVVLVLTYHEPGAPRFAWLALLAPLALLGLVDHSKVRPWLVAWKWISALALVVILVPFLSQQVQQALFPQLEEPGFFSQPVSMSEMAFGNEEGAFADASVVSETNVLPPSAAPMGRKVAGSVQEYAAGWGKSAASARDQEASKSNLAFDPKARIQTGPGIPNWTWRTVTLRWNGPVGADVTVEPILVPPTFERLLGALRVLLVLALAGWLLRRPVRLTPFKVEGSTKTAAPVGAAALLFLGIIFSSSSAQAEFPPAELLQTLQQRLLEPSEAFPQAAEIPLARLEIAGRELRMELEVHAAAEVALPLPGRLPDWSPLSVEVTGGSSPALRREGDFVWVALPAGVHRLSVRGLLPETNEWAWSFSLRPKRVEISAPGWTVTGLRTDGTPEQQILLVRETQSEDATPGETTFDRQPLENLVQVRRTLELGLQWRVRTEVVRLTPPGRAFSLRVPLLPGENLLTAQLETGGEGQERWVELNFSAKQERAQWEGELQVVPELLLRASSDATWVEWWEVEVSPIWNFRSEGLAPIFSGAQTELRPTWQPWPGEEVRFFLTRPEALPGPTLTVDAVTYTVTPGLRQSNGRLEGRLRASLAENLTIGLPDGAEVTQVEIGGNPLPVRLEEGKIVLPVRPGEQRFSLTWRLTQGLETRTAAPPVQISHPPANVDVRIEVPQDRWVLWTEGPQRGPAVRFWTVLVAATLAALILTRLPGSPLRLWEWLLLGLGLTQASLWGVGLIVGWLFLLAWRGQPSFQRLKGPGYNFFQLLIVVATPVVLIALLWIVAAGLLGDPKMFVTGWNSSPNLLNWFASPGATELPEVAFYSISLWWYRLAMLLWALWLAIAFLGWLKIGWKNLLSGGFWAPSPAKTSPAPPAPPELPKA